MSLETANNASKMSQMNSRLHHTVISTNAHTHDMTTAIAAAAAATSTAIKDTTTKEP